LQAIERLRFISKFLFYNDLERIVVPVGSFKQE